MLARKRSVSISGHRTSFSLEDEFFDGLIQIANSQNTSLAALVNEIDKNRHRESNLSSALRLYVLNAARDGLLPKQ
ncbi:MAG: ribbon-helix-helix domain-containing protein [Pseudomonadota bacterium]